MNKKYTEENYQELIQKLFQRFPSFQKVGAGAYKPGIANMIFADQLMGHKHKNYKIIHVAGTNGKGSVSNMLASLLAASGLKVGLYTSPHILDFRERMRVISENGGVASVNLIPELSVWNFVQQWQDTFDHLDLSFFEITTLMALDWFSEENVDVLVLETGLGGRLDSTNIVAPVLSIITNIGLDHCDMLGETLPEIAFEKAGIIKPKVPVVLGESHPDIDSVFERKVLYTNISEPEFMGNRNAILSLLYFAEKEEPYLWSGHENILSEMDLQGEYQRKNLRTVLASLSVLKKYDILPVNDDEKCLISAIVHTAKRTAFHGRWEKISDSPYIICDIGHNEHGLKYNFAQLAKMRADGKCSDLIVVFGSVADKDVDSVLHLMPQDSIYIFTQAHGKRALPASELEHKYKVFCQKTGRCTGKVYQAATVVEALELAKQIAVKITVADSNARPLIYIGGSTYVVSEAIACFC